jgi:hypothetical protein
MAIRSNLAAAILALASLTMISNTVGQQAASAATRADANASDGIRTDRLSPKQLQIWRSIEQIIQAVDRTGRPLHPKLFSLWQWAQTSGHTIYIEVLNEKHTATYNAGFLTIQESGSDGAQKAAVIQLWSWVIENASVQKDVRRPDGFIPFEGLGKLERYAQVVGHELAHAALQFNDPAYDHLCRELEKERAEFLTSRQQSRVGNVYDESTRQRLTRLASLTERIEKPAQSTEVEIWRELLNGQKNR